MASIGKIARRTFLAGAAVVAGGAAFGFYLYRKPFANPLEAGLDEGEATFNPFIKIGSDNSVTIIAPRAEMGQGVATTLAVLAAEELDVGLDEIIVEHGPASPAYYNAAMLRNGAPFPDFETGMMAETMRGAMGVVGKFVALQGTGGSTTTIDGFDKMRKAGALAREMLKAEAAERLGVAAGTLKTANRTVSDPDSGKSLTYGELAVGAAGRDAPEDVALRPRSEWKLIGKSQPRIDMRAKVTGAPIFGVDISLPDMVYATVRMNPRLGAPMKSIDAAAATKMRGVEKIVELTTRHGEGYAVIADNTWRAFMAADAVVAEWGDAAYPGDSAGIAESLGRTLSGPDGFELREMGDVDLAFADAPRERIVEAEYALPFLAHTTMEPMNATAWLHDGILEVWVPNQSPTLARSACAEAAGLPEEKVFIHTPYLGGGFGRRIEVDAAFFAVRIAMETGSRPVKVTWTREEDVTHDMYRPAARARYRARLDGDGFPVALAGEVAALSPIASALGRFFPSISPLGPDKTLLEGAYDQPYAFENYRITGKASDIPIPVGFWRSVGNSFNAFMHESFIDEIAAAGGHDPLDLRLKLMEPYPVATALLEKVAQMSGWRTALAPGRARGLAFTLSFGTWVVEVVEISGDADAVRIEKVWCAADPGFAVDPEIFEAQMMSGIVYGLSAAMGQAITFAGGQVEQSNFHDFDAMRMNQCPQIEVAILENSPDMGGAGEPGTPPVAPALANAVFALTGQRLRAMPLSDGVSFV